MGIKGGRGGRRRGDVAPTMPSNLGNVWQAGVGKWVGRSGKRVWERFRDLWSITACATVSVPLPCVVERVGGGLAQQVQNNAPCQMNVDYLWL